MSGDGFSVIKATDFIDKELGVSDWITMSQDRINQFAECTGDHQWIHVDAERARRESPFGTTVAHGYLTLAMLAETFFEVVAKPARMSQALNYGLDRVRFIAPVRSGSRIRNRIKLLAAEKKGDGRVLLTTENTIEIEGEGKPALIANALVMATGG
ncbi:MAG: MaoC family dehydratase [Acetobacteraceae bacterium]|nr:MaoC family dehydratase [Acetobacteraceae bacterium]MBV8591614.1 MaoC family dehydratase [Acetobacteraceae bacterium]